MRRALAAAALALVAVSCGAPLMKLPSGPGQPSPDAGDALAQATRTCRGVRTLTAEVAVRGSAGGRRLSGRLSAGVAAPASARLEAVAPFGPPVFIFVATGIDATLLMPRDDRILEHGRPDAVLAAVAGVPLSAPDLRAVLTGCAEAAPEFGASRQLGELWRVVPGMEGGELYLRRDRATAPWRLVAAVTRSRHEREWRAEYRDFQGDLPRAIHVMSVESGTPGAAFDLSLTLSQVDVNVDLEDAVFRVKVPATAQPITIDELRRSGPLARGSDDGR